MTIIIAAITSVERLQATQITGENNSLTCTKQRAKSKGVKERNAPFVVFQEGKNSFILKVMHC